MLTLQSKKAALMQKPMIGDLTARDSLHVAASGHFSLGFLAESNETSHWQRSSGGMFRKTKTREGYSLDVTPRTARYTSRLRSQSSGV